jgi:lipopolysaccharide export LptBFGC system permease protein LptF
MVLLAAALSASRGTVRGGRVGVMLALGALLGILFYVGAQILYALGQILNVSPPLVGLMPSLIVFIIAAGLFARLRW